MHISAIKSLHHQKVTEAESDLSKTHWIFGELKVAPVAFAATTVDRVIVVLSPIFSVDS
jgi:hypothetical protein